MDTTTCPGCKATIFWIHSGITGNLMPLDAKPAAEGNVVILDGKAHVTNDPLFDIAETTPRYTNHFATCIDRKAKMAPKK